MDSAAPKLGVQGTTIVLIGSFNPRIFHPLWFSQQELVPPSEADGADVKLIHEQASALKMGPFSLQVFTDRFQANVVEPQDSVPLRDLVVGTFTVLQHTPIEQMGINRQLHFVKDGPFSWEAFEEALVPKTDVWRSLSNVSTRIVELRSDREDDDASEGFVGVRVEPSVREPGGVYMQVNDHYEVTTDETPHGAEDIIGLLAKQFEKSLQRAKVISVQVLEDACRPQH